MMPAAVEQAEPVASDGPKRKRMRREKKDGFDYTPCPMTWDPALDQMEPSNSDRVNTIPALDMVMKGGTEYSEIPLASEQVEPSSSEGINLNAALDSMEDSPASNMNLVISPDFSPLDNPNTPYQEDVAVENNADSPSSSKYLACQEAMAVGNDRNILTNPNDSVHQDVGNNANIPSDPVCQKEMANNINIPSNPNDSRHQEEMIVENDVNISAPIPNFNEICDTLDGNNCLTFH